MLKSILTYFLESKVEFKTFYRTSFIYLFQYDEMIAQIRTKHEKMRSILSAELEEERKRNSELNDLMHEF